MVEALATAAAVAFALGNVLQQRGTTEVPADRHYGPFLLLVVGRPVWLAGLALQILGWLFQACALANGQLVVVQAICAVSVVLVLPFGARLTAQQVTMKVAVGSISTVIGIVVFLVIGRPNSGTGTPGVGAWWIAGLGTFFVVGGCANLARVRTGATQALLFGTAAGFCFALQGAVTKQVVGSLGAGVVHALVQWPLYILLGTALVGFALWQLSLRADVLAPAMASSNAASLLGGVLLGVTLFGETLHHEGASIELALLGLTMALVGVVLLSTAPSPVDPRAAVIVRPGSPAP